MVTFAADKFRPEVKVDDAELAPYFEAHKEQYRIGEKRKIRFVLVDVDALRAASRPTAREVERAYNDSIELYSTPEQVRASHILLKTAGKKEDEVKAKAEQILKEVKAGGDFAALAKKYSEDEGSAKQGGDLDFFGKGRMDPAFEEAAFRLQPGEISDVVKSQYGFHIIKVTDKKAASTRTLDEVRPQIEDQLSYEKANVKAGDLAAAIEKEISKPADLDKAAKANGLQVQESGFFTREEPILGLGPSPQAAAEAFTLEAGRRERRGARVARLGVPHRDRHAGAAPADAGRGEGPGQGRRDEAEGEGPGAAEGDGGGGDAQGRGRLDEGGEGGRRRGEDHRARGA